MKDDTGVVGATQGKGRIPWDPRGRVRSTAARRARTESVLLGAVVVDVAGLGLSTMWSMSTSVVMDGSPVVWLELNVLVCVWEETLSPLS